MGRALSAHLDSSKVTRRDARNTDRHVVNPCNAKDKPRDETARCTLDTMTCREHAGRIHPVLGR